VNKCNPGNGGAWAGGRWVGPGWGRPGWGGDAWVAGNPGWWAWNSGGWGWNTGWWGPGSGVTFGWPVAMTWPTTVVGSWTSVPVAVDASAREWRSEASCAEPRIHSGRWSIHGDRR
jgi:hypothetical protein